ncbi:unnamed protein product [Camellia sinensis]
MVACIEMETGNASVSSSKPNVVNIGALYTFNSAIGRSAKPGIEAAVDDVNSNSTVLAGMKLNLILHDTNCSGFLGTVEALLLMENDVVVVIGLRPSGIAQVISHVFPYFLCTRHSDYFQMYAIADLIKFYGWREVVTIFVNDDYGRNGISVLGDALTKKHAKISYKIVFTLGASRSDINDLLVRVNMMESRVYVFHVNLDSGLTIFSVAKLLWMLTAGYIWIATDWWKNFTYRETSSFNSYALYAYDFIWLLACAFDVFFNEGGSSSFSYDPRLHDTNGSTLHLIGLCTFQEGWVFPNNRKPLRIAVPNRVSHLEYATKDKGPLTVKGYCIDVFEAAIKLSPYAVPHTYTIYGDGLRNASYNNRVHDVAQNLNIAESRMKTLKNQEEYVDTLHKGPKAGGVATIVDSFLTLSSYCTRPTANLDLWDKNLLKTDGDLDSPLVVDLSTAILRLLENSELQRIHDRWILLNRCFAQANQVDENILYTPKDEEQDIDEHESIRPKSTLHVTSFKDFVDKKEDEVMESIKQKSDSKRQASQCFDGHPSSPSS